MFLDKEQLLNRRKQWEAFNDWEKRSQKAWDELDPANACKWYGAAWEMAKALNPKWAQGLDHEKILQLQKIRGALALLGRSK